MPIFRLIFYSALSALLFISSAQAGSLTVSAAASLSDALKEIAQHYEQHYPDNPVMLNFAASGVLLQQINRGAPVDLFISADETTIERANKLKLIKTDSIQPFTRNQLVLIQPQQAKLKPLKKLADL